MRKRTLSIVLAAAMCASLTACGGGGSTAETTPQLTYVPRRRQPTLQRNLTNRSVYVLFTLET